MTSTFREQFASAVAVEHETFAKLRKKAWERFIAQALPDHATEAFQYVRLNKLYEMPLEAAKTPEISKEEVAQFVLPECVHSNLVFVDGTFRKELSNTTHLPSQIVVESLSKAFKTYSTLLQNSAAAILQNEKNPFVFLNLACSGDGAFVYVPPKIALQTPLQVIHLITQKNCWMMPRLTLFQGAQSELTLVSTVATATPETVFSNGFFDLTLEENSHLTFVQSSLNAAAHGVYFEQLRATQKRSSTLKTIQLTDSSLQVRRDSHILLAGENAEAQLNGIALLDDTKEAHTHAIVEHAEPYTRSMQLFKNVLNDSAQSSFEGKILVGQKAQKTDAYQLNNNLILSDLARANSKPNLEVFADDVKASHGATTGQLDPEELFYLRSRGLNEHDAKNALIAGFCEEVSALIPLASLREVAQASIQRFLRG